MGEQHVAFPNFIIKIHFKDAVHSECTTHPCVDGGSGEIF